MRRVHGRLPLLCSASARLFSSSSLRSDVPVVIVGAGPVGMTLSILLNKLGVESLLVEKRSTFSDHPQAHFINNRTMEIFRRMDGLAAAIQALQPPLEHWRRFIYCTSLDGQILGSVNHIHPEDLISNRSPTNVAHFSQNRLLPILLENATRAGISLNANAVDQGSSIFMGYDCVNVDPSPTNVLATLSPVGCASKTKTVSCQYLVAADGAGSSIRRSMGVKFEGDHNLQQLISVHFISRKLSSYLLQNRPGMLFFVFNPNAIAVIVAHDLRSGEFVAQIPFYPPQHSADEFTNEACGKIIRQLVSIDIDLEIKTVKPWVMHAEVANKYLCGKGGRIILAGDAAHRFPPAGGFGMNTGIQDAHNLAWKLAAVLKGVASTYLLQSYETERRPIAVANTALSVANFKAAMSIPSALGLDPTYARLVHESINSSVGSFLPKAVQSAVLNSVFSIGRVQVSPLFLNKYNPVAQARISEVQKILEQGRSLQLQFPAEDLLFRYTKGALLSECSSEDVTDSSERRREYVPCSVPGVRLPHMSIRVVSGSSSKNQDVCSTLDLVDGKRLEFLLFVECSMSGLGWAEDAIQVAKSSGIPVRVVIIVSEEEKQAAESSERSFIKDWKLRYAGDDDDTYTEVWGTDGRKWWEVCGVSAPQVVLLVRPDDHIAWRSLRQHDCESVEELKKALGTVFRVEDDDQVASIRKY